MRGQGDFDLFLQTANMVIHLLLYGTFFIIISEIWINNDILLIIGKSHYSHTLLSNCILMLNISFILHYIFKLHLLRFALNTLVFIAIELKCCANYTVIIL